MKVQLINIRAGDWLGVGIGGGRDRWDGRESWRGCPPYHLIKLSSTTELKHRPSGRRSREVGQGHGAGVFTSSCGSPGLLTAEGREGRAAAGSRPCCCAPSVERRGCIRERGRSALKP
ncbi:hypothetical protein AAFF_G00293700 [Aldrovandia affinis]|uniref:Uncharacterized protein n=1 Tax=Aldrovandia affinis TaxID=143900 RepID=A0AAD7R9V5_9TELE|nr:hypothetical protein AAFF_G00293700 [Aldrovandia affinis]